MNNGLIILKQNLQQCIKHGELILCILCHEIKIYNFKNSK